MIDELKTAPGYWYLASPYSKYPEGIDAAYAVACQAAAQLMDAGVRVFCPIAHTHPIARYVEHERTHAFWLEQDEPLLDAAHGLIVLKMPGWESSYGVQWETRRTVRSGRPVHYLNWPLTGI